eukprot:Phypoly_transcript_08761.p1 GENE.Phypoly_transcript_08761~~Phypoly_transcript_08761.p1  ORF type:complete len:404 (+),score=65.39 Phypoly_transcript_08761:102-1313(+)
MHVLLINCHSATDESNKVWKEFERLVRKCFSHMIEMMHFTVRNMSELAEYLDSRYFDKIDFIFIDGDKTYKPWAPSAKPLVTLLKMCCQVGFKCVFGTAPLLTSLCFIVATGGKDTKIKGKGGSIASLQQGDAEPSGDTLYLNNRTGDAYQSVATDTCHIWKPVMNIGLKVHVPPHPQSDIPRSVTESLLKKSKTCLHHWAFAGVPDQFVVPTASHFWDVADIPEWHSTSPKNGTNKRNTSPPKDPVCSSLTILADIECGPAILEYDSIVAVHFAITEIYPHTVHILQNFISTKLDIMMNFGNQAYPSHRLYRKLTAVGNFSKFEERPKPIPTPPRAQPFPSPQPPLSLSSITPKNKIPLSSPLFPSLSHPLCQLPHKTRFPSLFLPLFCQKISDVGNCTEKG